MRVGLTGGVASGKSTVSRLLRELGAVVIDADLLAREAVLAGSPGLAAVVAEFGPEVLTPEGELDRPAVARIVFADDDARRRLEGIVHPLVRAAADELAAEAAPGVLVVHDVPLLTETGQAGEYDAVVVVDVPAQVQVERMMRDRGMTREEAEARIRAQADRAERLAVATHVVENTGTLEELRARVRALHEELIELAERDRPGTR
jgi:dephospho-CoA kinase